VVADRVRDEPDDEPEECQRVASEVGSLLSAVPGAV
jgi:hypothetical protein